MADKNLIKPAILTPGEPGNGMEVDGTQNLSLPVLTARRNSVASTASASSAASGRKRPRHDTDDVVEHNASIATKALEHADMCTQKLQSYLSIKDTSKFKITKDGYLELVQIFDELSNLTKELARDNQEMAGRLKERASIKKLIVKCCAEKPKTFSDVVTTGNVSGAPTMGARGTAKRDPKPGPKYEAIIKSAKPDERMDSESIKKTVLQAINPVSSGIRVKAVRKLKEGLIVETDTQDGLDKIIASCKVEDGKLTAVRTTRRQPRVVVYDVPATLTEDEFREALLQQNQGIRAAITAEELKTEMRLAFKTGKRDEETANWVFETTARMRNLLMSEGKIFIVWRRCKVDDFTLVTRCYKCQGLGHVAKSCKQEEETCGICAEEGHKMLDCPNKTGARKCAVCKRVGKPHTHKADSSCPLYKQIRDRIIANTEYG